MTRGGMSFMDEKADKGDSCSRLASKVFITDSPLTVEYVPDQTLIKICADLKIKSLEQD